MAVMARGVAIEFLLASEEPAIRYLTRRDVLGEDVTPDREEILSGPLNLEVVDWGVRGRSEMTTLNALRILKAAGRLDP